MVNNTWKEYELFVGQIQQSLLNAEGISHIKNITVEVNKKILDRNGIQRQFDVYWEFMLGGQLYKSIIECKDYASAITIDKIDALIGKTNDIPGLRLIYATKKGYQSGAKIKAEQHKIDLLIVREGVNEDWTDQDGNPLVREISLNITAILSPRIISFSPFVDSQWLKINSILEPEEIDKKLGLYLNNQLFINNKTKNTKTSLYDLANSLPSIHKDIRYGSGEFSENFEDAYIETYDEFIKVKIKGYKLSYEYHEPRTITSTIDYSKQLLGIVQNFQTGEKKMVFIDGVIKNTF